MALATQCPHCHTTFRVAHDQLKLRAGLVRCGACKQIFNGIENLLRPELIAPAAAPEPLPAAQPQPSATPGDATEQAGNAIPDELTGIPVEAPQAVPPESADDPQNRPEADAFASTIIPATAEAEDPLLRMTLMDFSHAERKSNGEDSAQAAEQRPDAPNPPDPLERVIDDLQRKPWRAAQDEIHDETDALDWADHGEYEEPGFVKQGRRRQRIGSALRVAMAVALPFLLAGLLAQGAYTFRDQLAARFPQAKPLLTRACAYIDCQVGLPMQIESVSIESSELQALNADQNTFSLAVLLRNRGETVQAWPSIELTLNDAGEKAIARRVFLPRDYLQSQQEVSKGFASKSEQAVKLFFELPQIKASGYRVYLFYP